MAGLDGGAVAGGAVVGDAVIASISNVARGGALAAAGLESAVSRNWTEDFHYTIVSEKSHHTVIYLR